MERPTPSAVLLVVVILLLGVYVVGAEVLDPGLLGHSSAHVATVMLGVVGILIGGSRLLGMGHTPLSSWLTARGTSRHLIFWGLVAAAGIYAIARGGGLRIGIGVLDIMLATAMVVRILKRSRLRGASSPSDASDGCVAGLPCRPPR